MNSARACLCNVAPGLCWAQQLQGSFCSQGADSFIKVTIGSSHGMGKPYSTFSIGDAWLQGAGHAVGTKQTTLKDKLTPYFIVVDEFTIPNYEFPKEFNDAIL